MYSSVASVWSCRALSPNTFPKQMNRAHHFFPEGFEHLPYGNPILYKVLVHALQETFPQSCASEPRLPHSTCAEQTHAPSSRKHSIRSSYSSSDHSSLRSGPNYCQWLLLPIRVPSTKKGRANVENGLTDQNPRVSNRRVRSLRHH